MIQNQLGTCSRQAVHLSVLMLRHKPRMPNSGDNSLTVILGAEMPVVTHSRKQRLKGTSPRVTGLEREAGLTVGRRQYCHCSNIVIGLWEVPEEEVQINPWKWKAVN